MTSKHKYDIRIIVDDAFVRSVEESEDYDLNDFLLRLSYIHKTSVDHKMDHVKILDGCFKSLTEDMNGDKIIGAMSPEQPPNFIQNVQDMDSRVIKYAINLADEEPYSTFIFTGEDRKQDYKDNEHFQKLTGGVQIASPSYAEDVIDSLHPKRDGDEDL